MTIFSKEVQVLKCSWEVSKKRVAAQQDLGHISVAVYSSLPRNKRVGLAAFHSYLVFQLQYLGHKQYFLCVKYLVLQTHLPFSVPLRTRW